MIAYIIIKYFFASIYINSHIITCIKCMLLVLFLFYHLIIERGQFFNFLIFLWRILGLASQLKESSDQSFVMGSEVDNFPKF